MEKDYLRSFLTENISEILEDQKPWKGVLDIFKAFDKAKSVKYLLKDMTPPHKTADDHAKPDILALMHALKEK